MIIERQVKAMAWTAVIVYLLLITPVQAGLLLEWGEGQKAAHVGVMLWGIKKVFHFPLKRTEDGVLYLETPSPLRKRKKHKKTKQDLLTLIARLLYLRKKTHAFIRLRLFTVQAFVSLPQAGHTALLCGLLSGLFAALSPHGNSRFVPVYPGPNKCRAACILEGRLGTICMAAILWHAHKKRHTQKEERTWSIPSQN